MNQPVKLFKAKATSVVIVYLMNSVFQNLPCLLGVLGIPHGAVLERFYVVRSLLLRAHFPSRIGTQNPTELRAKKVQFRERKEKKKKKQKRRRGNWEIERGRRTLATWRGGRSDWRKELGIRVFM